jgi:sodium-dependent dicarboxylate transporter 2/3/5
MFSKQRLGLLLGPLSFIVIQFISFSDLSEEGRNVLATTSWMAIWWILEAIPIAATALLPIVLFPVTNAVSISNTTAAYGHKYVFLYLGGFLIAIAIERWNLHKRIALNIISAIGTKINLIILGFMVATAFLSMWISNTATSVMMLPIALAIIKQLEDNPSTSVNENKQFGKALLLSIAYSASIGGIATIIGTPPNLVLAGVVESNFGYEISFFKWFVFGFPISMMMLFICWQHEINRLKNNLGKMSVEEKRVAFIFFLTALCWISRSFLLQKFIPNIDDTIIAISFGLILFVIPSSDNKRALITWKEAVKLPWGVIILFGGGMALAKGFVDTGLAIWIGSKLTILKDLPLIILILCLVTVVNFLTEITSNLATTAMLLPVLATMSSQVNIHPFILMVGATVAASCAFMLPVATPPNAVVFGAGYLRIPDMVNKGFWLNIISIIVITLMVYFVLPSFWDISLTDSLLEYKN